MNDKDTNIEELKEIMEKFVKDRGWQTYHKPKDLAIAISIEANELLELFLFKNTQIEEIINEGKLRTSIKDELADVLAYLLSMCTALQIDLTEIFVQKMKKNEEKYSTDKFNNGFYEKR